MGARASAEAGAGPMGRHKWHQVPRSWTAVHVEDLKAAEPHALATGPFGSSISSKYFQEEGVPVLRGGNLSEEVGIRLATEDLVFLSPEKAEEFKRSTVARGDLVFTCWGTVGQVGLIDERSPYEKYVLSNKQMKLSPDPAKADSLFLYYLFSGPMMLARIQAEAIGSSVPGFNLKQLRGLSLHLPPLAEQLAIASVLGVLDDKIELNHLMNQTLEAMARAIFKAWFVDFEPAQRGRPWRPETATVGSLAMINREAITPTDFPAEVFHHYSIPAYDESRAPKAERGEAIKSNKFLCPAGAILVSKLNPRIPRVWLPSVSAEARSICSTEFLVVTPRERDSDREFLYSLFWSSEFMDRFASRTTGTSGSHQRVHPEDLLRMEVSVPARAGREQYSATVRPLFDKVARGLEECQTLAALRDTLLPKLLSGEIRVKQAEKIVEATV